jgi:sucrose phosphorylase
MEKMIRARIGSRSFHPNGDQLVVRVSPSVFSLIRVSPDALEKVLCLTNVTDRDVQLSIGAQTLSESVASWRDIITANVFPTESGDLHLTMKPYEVLWLSPSSER